MSVADPQEFSDLGALFDAHIQRGFADHDVKFVRIARGQLEPAPFQRAE